MNIEVLADSGSVARRAASISADEAWEAIAARGLFVLAVRGSHTPWLMLRELAAAGIPWRAAHIFQIDERVAPAGHTTGTSRISARACSTTLRFPPNRFMRCPSNHAIWRQQPPSMPRLCAGLPDHPLCLAIRC